MRIRLVLPRIAGSKQHARTTLRALRCRVHRALDLRSTHCGSLPPFAVHILVHTRTGCRFRFWFGSSPFRHAGYALAHVPTRMPRIPATPGSFTPVLGSLLVHYRTCRCLSGSHHYGHTWVLALPVLPAMVLPWILIPSLRGSAMVCWIGFTRFTHSCAVLRTACRAPPTCMPSSTVLLYGSTPDYSYTRTRLVLRACPTHHSYLPLLPAVHPHHRATTPHYHTTHHSSTTDSLLPGSAAHGCSWFAAARSARHRVLRIPRSFKFWFGSLVLPGSAGYGSAWFAVAAGVRCGQAWRRRRTPTPPATTFAWPHAYTCRTHTGLRTHTTILPAPLTPCGGRPACRDDGDYRTGGPSTAPHLPPVLSTAEDLAAHYTYLFAARALYGGVGTLPRTTYHAHTALPLHTHLPQHLPHTPYTPPHAWHCLHTAPSRGAPLHE